MLRNTLLNPLRVGAIGIASALSATAATAGSSPVGVWLDDKGRGAIEIKQCGQTLCGHVVWVKNTKDKKGCGRKMIGKVRQVSQNRWDGGWIYSPERRKTYDVELRPLDNGNLRVTGYAGTKLFSRTMIWKPAPADLIRCGDDPAITAKAQPNAAAPATVEEKPTADLPDVTVTQSNEPVTNNNAATVTEASPPATTGTVGSTAKMDGDTDETQPQGNENEVASADADVIDDDSEGPPAAREKGLDLGELGLDRFLKRSASGNCKLDLPWVKVDFACK